jgi:hypothetical protein
VIPTFGYDLEFGGPVATSPNLGPGVAAEVALLRW